MHIKLIRTICMSKKAKRTGWTKLLAAMALVCLVAVGPTPAMGQPTFSVDFASSGAITTTGPFVGFAIMPDDILSSPDPFGPAPLGVPALGPLPPPRISLVGGLLGIVPGALLEGLGCGGGRVSAGWALGGERAGGAADAAAHVEQDCV